MCHVDEYCWSSWAPIVHGRMTYRLQWQRYSMRSHSGCQVNFLPLCKPTVQMSHFASQLHLHTASPTNITIFVCMHNDNITQLILIKKIISHIILICSKILQHKSEIHSLGTKLATSATNCKESVRKNFYILAH